MSSLPKISPKEGVAPLLEWYDTHRRPFPWRETNDPYAIWISEVMLQQTQAARGVEYHERWMRCFPTLQALANADESEVLKVWEGLGYYSRARNLLYAARLLRERGMENLPSSFEELRSLPGVGPYTAAAVASIAFGLPVPALDANGKRVFSRLLDLELPVDRRAGENIIRKAFEQMIPSDRPGDFNSAIMELGATLCAPASALCDKCPLSFLCLAGLRGTPLDRPVLSRQTKARSVYGALFIFIANESVFLRKRPSIGLWADFEEFPWSAPPAEPGTPLLEWAKDIGSCDFGTIRSSFTKWRLRLDLKIVRLRRRAEIPCGQGRWVGASELSAITLPAGSRKVRERLFSEKIIPPPRRSS